MFQYLLLFLLSLNLFALEVSLQGAKEDFVKYSTLHIKDPNPFLCQETFNDFLEVDKIICAFSKQPSTPFRTLQNEFFEIKGQVKEKTFFLIITPQHKMKLFNQLFDLHVDKTLFDTKSDLGTHWMVLGYHEKMPFMQTEPQSEVAINFPFYSENDLLPHVGGLDMQGNPVKINKVKDVKGYINIKKLFQEKKYEQCLDLIDEVSYEHPNSLFKSEFLFYRIKSYFALGMYDSVIEDSKIFLREYSADENIAEVLSMVAKSYSKAGLNTDADYFFDRLFSEHADSEFSRMGFIYKGEILEDSGASSKALEFYLKAVNQTQDLGIAALAAYKLAFYKIYFSNKKEAAEYVQKILGAKSDFFYENLEKSLELMYLFEEEKDYVSAAGIAKAILDEMNPKNEIYEELLSQRGIWLSQTDKKEEALQALNEYLTTYKYGFYEDSIQVAKDSLFFDQGDVNTTAKIAEYNQLIEKYRGDSIGDKALYEKAKLLLENGMYSDILGFKDSLLALDETKYPQKEELITQSATGVMQRALENKECQEVLNISYAYNITLSDKWDDGLYECFMKGADFIEAKKIAQKNITSQDLEERKKWLYRHSKVDFATGNYSEVIEASRDLVTLIQEEKDSQYNDIYRLVFDTYQRLENDAKMLSSIADVEKVFGQDSLDIERYIAVMNVGVVREDPAIIITYGEKVDQIQKRTSSYAQSPFVEFSLYQAYMNKQRYNDALEIIKSLDTIELDANTRSRQKYLLGSVYDKLWRDDDADKAYDASIEADASSAWAKLSESAKKI
ncbi:MAG: flagellar protein [Sulfurimonas sp.]|nr:flagellar protein [Sulfurimonas sp.]